MNTTCTRCNKNYIYNRKNGHRKSVCNECNVTICRQRRKQKCINYKGGKCQKCGYKKCQAAIEFHHRIPEQKDFSINNNLHRRNIDDRIKKELDKCDILCANCHREEHWM